MPNAATYSEGPRVIDIVDRSGTAAMVKATLKHGATTFTDYFVLLKPDGQWLIATRFITLDYPPHKPERRDRVSPAHIQS